MSVRTREVILTGIGGQGVQLAGQVLARAAMADGRHAQLFQNYGGLMRGGQTEASLVVSDEPVHAPPVLGSTWAAVAMHHEHWPPVRDRLRADGLALVNTSIVTDPGLANFTGATLEVPATDVAVDLGQIVGASLVMVGVLAAVTELVSATALESGLRDALPTYRRNGVDEGISALDAGRSLADLPHLPVWTRTAAST